MSVIAPDRPPVDSTIVANIRAELARRGLRQDALSAALGLARTAVSSRLTGKTKITAAELYVIADVLDLPVTQLYAPIPAGGEAEA